MLLYNICNICKYTYYTYIFLKTHQTLWLPSIYGDCDHDSKVRRFMSRIQVHLTFIVQLSYPPNNVTPKRFVFLLVINYFTNY